MTILEAEKFYKNDKKEYDVKNNVNFINWLNDLIRNGYDSYCSLEDIQELIDNIAIWYEIKYPERFLDNTATIDRFKNIKSITKQLSIEQLLYRLSNKNLSLLDAHYRSNSGGWRNIYNEKGEVIGSNKVVGVEVTRKNYNIDMLFTENKNRYELITIDAITGKVKDLDNLKSYLIYNQAFSIEQLLSYFENSFKLKEYFDYLQIKKCVYNNQCDKKLRNEILQLAALKLLYSKNTIPKLGYIRAKKFIKEFNNKFNLELSTSYIDEIMSRDYSEINKQNPKLKKVFK